MSTIEQLVAKNRQAKVGDWLVKKDPYLRVTKSGKITSIKGDKVEFFDANAWDGFGMTMDADLTDVPEVRVELDQ